MFLNYTDYAEGKLKAYELYKNDQLINLNEQNNGFDIKKAEKEIKTKWDNLSEIEKDKYEQIKQRNENYLRDLKKFVKLTSQNIYFKKQFKKNTKANFSEISTKWNKLDDKIKNEYRTKADIENSKNERILDVSIYS